MMSVHDPPPKIGATIHQLQGTVVPNQLAGDSHHGAIRVGRGSAFTRGVCA
jgi:hypothetical protein